MPVGITGLMLLITYVRSFRHGMNRYWGAEKTREYYGRKAPFNTSEDISRFRSWVRLPTVRGLVAARFHSGYSAWPRVDCWIITDALRETLDYCLQQYLRQGGSVRIPQLASAWSDGMRNHTNNSPHGACEAYFDDALASEVTRGFDRSLYSAFNWSHCCGNVKAVSIGARIDRSVGAYR